jgi:hypothetical protein
LTLIAASRAARLGEIEGKLHPHQMVHLGAERLFDPESHFGRQSRPLVQQVRERLPRDASTDAASVTDRPRGSTISRRIKPPRWGGVFIGIVVSFQ